MANPPTCQHSHASRHCCGCSSSLRKSAVRFLSADLRTDTNIAAHASHPPHSIQRRSFHATVQCRRSCPLNQRSIQEHANDWVEYTTHAMFCPLNLAVRPMQIRKPSFALECCQELANAHSRPLSRGSFAYHRTGNAEGYAMGAYAVCGWTEFEDVVFRSFYAIDTRYCSSEPPKGGTTNLILRTIPAGLHLAILLAKLFPNGLQTRTHLLAIQVPQKIRRRAYFYSIPRL